MTREEQIFDIAAQYAINETDGQNGGKAASKRGLLLSAFRDGAHWADSYPNWISVEDDLPDVDEQTTLSNECVVVDSAGARYFGFYNGTDECWYTDDYTMILFVTHWMEIVPPRKEGKE